MGIALKLKKTVELVQKSLGLNGLNSESSLLEKPARHTVTDRANLYREKKSFSDFIPLSEWLEEEQMVLFDDHVSVGCLWEVEMCPTEAKSDGDLQSIEAAIDTALETINLEHLSDGQYVLSSYITDDYTLAEDLEELKASIHPDWVGTPLAEAYLDSCEKMFRGLESEQGLFKEGGDESSRAFRGGRRVPRMMLYRRVPMKDRKGKEKLRNSEIENLTHIRANLEDSFGTSGVKLKRMKRERFYEFMVRWFNPKPVSTNGSVNDLLKVNPCPPEEIAALDGEFAMSFLFNSPHTDSENGVIKFDDCPSRFIQVDRISKIPDVGSITAEKVTSGGDDFYAQFDLLPFGTMFVKHIFFQTQEEAAERARYIADKSQFIDDKAKLVNEEANEVSTAISKGARLFKVEMGFYCTSLTQAGLDKKSRAIGSFANLRLGLGVIDPKNNLFPVESYLRNLPFVQDPILDGRRRRGRMSWLNQSVSLLPLLGRKRGHESQGSKRCMTAFNRGGEVINIDPLNRESNAHMVLLGPTGTGKSATLNKTIIELLIFHNARLVIAEAGLSFDPVMDFLEAQNADIQRINITSGAQGRPIAPFANARFARDQMVREMEKMGMSQNSVVEKVIEELSFEDENEAISDRIRMAMEEDTEASEMEKDYLGECVMIGKIMATGGLKTEEDKFGLRDSAHLADCIIDAVSIADLDNEELVRPEHVVKALRARSKNEKMDIDDGMRSRLKEMADIMGRYTKPGDVRSQIVNQKAEPFKKCDCVHVELGIAQRSNYEDILALAYLALLNNVNDIAERKELENDDRPIYVITDEAHLILKHRMIAPIAIKIVRMWRKYGAWFLPATQDTSSFKEGAEAILVIGEMFICLSPPEDEIEVLASLLNLSEEQIRMIRTAKMAKHKYTEGVYFNRQRKSATLFRILQPSFCLSVAGSEDKEKLARRQMMREYSVRMAGAVLIEAANIDLRRGLISKEEREKIVENVANDDRYKIAA